jgi:hypothetical protein
VWGFMSNPIHVVLLLSLFAFWFGQAYLAGRLAAGKGRSFGLYLVAWRDRRASRAI